MTLQVFSSEGVRRGRMRLALTALVLALVALAGLILRGEARLLGEDLGAVVYAVGLAGLVGFGTNWLAIRMLFHPRLPVMGVQGVVPKKRIEIADRASALLEERLISGDRLHDWLLREGKLDAIASYLREKLPAALTQGEARETLLNAAHLFIQDATPPLMTRLREIVLDQVKQQMGGMSGMVLPMIEPMMGPVEERVQAYVADRDNMQTTLEQAGDRVESAVASLLESAQKGGGIEAQIQESLREMLQGIAVADLIREEILKQDDAELEAMINDAASDQLVFLQVAGGILGMAAGLALTWPLLVLPYAALIALGWRLSAGADRRAQAMRTQAAETAQTSEDSSAAAESTGEA